MLLWTYIDNDTNIVINLDNIFTDELVLFQDNIEINHLLIKKTSSICNRALMAIICLCILCYAWNKCSNILQKVNS